jgi:integrase
VYFDRWGADVADSTRHTLEEWLAPAREAFGSWTLRELEGGADDIARWRAKLPEGPRYRATRALRQALAAAVRWRYMASNPAVEAGVNPTPRPAEIDPFTVEEIEAICAEVDIADRALVVFASETGLRTNEWTAIERRDIDRDGPAALVRRRYARGHATPYPKTKRRRVPLPTAAFEAIQSLPPRLDTPLVFPPPRVDRSRSTTGGGGSGIRRSKRRGSGSAARTSSATPSPPGRWRRVCRSSSWRG